MDKSVYNVTIKSCYFSLKKERPGFGYIMVSQWTMNQKTRLESSQ